MVTRPFLSTQLMDSTIPRLRARGLETRLALDGRLVRFRTPAGTVTGPITVVVAWANTQPTGQRGTTDVIGVDGDLHGRPADVTGVLLAGTLFQLDGNPCEVTQDALTDRGIGIVPFRMTGQGA